MRHITKRDLVVVSITAAVLALIAAGIYINQNYKMVPVSEAAAKKEEPVPPSDSKPARRSAQAGSQAPNQPVYAKHQAGQRMRSKSGADFNHRVPSQPEAWTPQPTAPSAVPVPAAPVQTVRVDVQAPQPAQPQWQPAPSYDRPVAYETRPAYEPGPAYREDAPRRRGMSTATKVAISSSIAAGVITAVALSRRHR